MIFRFLWNSSVISITMLDKMTAVIFVMMDFLQLQSAVLQSLGFSKVLWACTVIYKNINFIRLLWPEGKTYLGFFNRYTEADDSSNYTKSTYLQLIYTSFLFLRKNRCNRKSWKNRSRSAKAEGNYPEKCNEKIKALWDILVSWVSKYLERRNNSPVSVSVSVSFILSWEQQSQFLLSGLWKQIKWLFLLFLFQWKCNYLGDVVSFSSRSPGTGLKTAKTGKVIIPCYLQWFWERAPEDLTQSILQIPR